MVLFVDSFFFPHKCAFASGQEAQDASHKAFMALVVWQVDHDKRMLRANANILKAFSGGSSDKKKAAPSSGAEGSFEAQSIGTIKASEYSA